MTVDVSYCDSKTVDRCHNSKLVLSEQIKRFGGTTSEVRSGEVCGDGGHRLGLEKPGPARRLFTPVHRAQNSPSTWLADCQMTVRQQDGCCLVSLSV